jgi:hypothetical protein
LLIVCVGVASLIIYSDPKRRGPFWDKYQMLEWGMTKTEVEEILGQPTSTDSPGDTFGPDICAWEDGERMIVVSFDVRYTDGKRVVVEKYFLPESLWEKVQRVVLKSTAYRRP